MIDELNQLKIVDQISNLINDYRNSISYSDDEMDTGISLENVTYSYADKPPILINCNIEAPKRKATLILGENGSGKTTILKLLANYATPKEGKIHPEMKKLIIGYSASDGSDLNPFLRVIDIIKMIREDQGDLVWIEKAITLLGIPNSKDSRIRSLSSGEKKKFSILRAFLVGRELILLDEPESHLDFVTRDIVSHVISRMSKIVTIVLASHDMSFIEKCYCENVYILKPIEQGTKKYTASKINLGH